jgi:hypothetical protein
MPLWDALYQLVVSLWLLLVEVFRLSLTYALLIAYVAWWLWGVNWQKLWPTLSRGAWAPLVLLTVIAALAWAEIAPATWHGIPNFWWQLGASGLLVGLALFCGWLQGVFGWTPPEMNLGAATASVHNHGHGDDSIHDTTHIHDHGPEHAHSHPDDHAHQ